MKVFVVVMVKPTLPYSLARSTVLKRIVAYSMGVDMVWTVLYSYWLKDKAELGFILISFCYCPMRGLRLGLLM